MENEVKCPTPSNYGLHALNENCFKVRDRTEHILKLMLDVSLAPITRRGFPV